VKHLFIILIEALIYNIYNKKIFSNSHIDFPSFNGWKQILIFTVVEI